ncbi:MAG: ribosome small subunit-dependent GTPase A [Patescibacteria group bacterium]|jgi:ribosome biogenesis GTPase
MTKINHNINRSIDFGYQHYSQLEHSAQTKNNLQVARVVAEHKGAYQIINTTGEYFAKITGKRIFNAQSREDYPAVGDWVSFSDAGDSKAVINQVLPRISMIKRKASGNNDIQIIATNIDVAFLVTSIDQDFSLNRIERYLAIVSDGGAKPAIIINKIDLAPESELELKINQIKDRFNDIDLIQTSNYLGNGLDELKNYLIKGRTYCFLGSSGVGKSSLINKLIGKEVIDTQGIDTRTGRGRHTTTGRDMYFLDSGAIVIDNPGMREVGLTNSSVSVDNVFDQIISLSKQCKYADCTHTQEPGCNVLDAVKLGSLEESKYHNFISLKKESEYYELSELEKKQKDHRFGKFIKNAKEQIQNL